MKGEAVIEISDVLLRLGGKDILRCHSAKLEVGTLTALIGPNGSGKSSLLKALCGLHRVSGSILLRGQDIASYSARELARNIAVVFTGRSEVPGVLRAQELIAFGRYPWYGTAKRGDRSESELIEKYAAMAGVAECLERPVWQLSDGEFQKVMIARALVQEAEVLLLDEPLSFLDYPSRRMLLAILKSLSAEGKIILFSTHDLELALPYAHHCWEVEGKQPGILVERTAGEAGRAMNG